MNYIQPQPKFSSKVVATNKKNWRKSKGYILLQIKDITNDMERKVN